MTAAEQALAPLRAMLEADGYGLAVEDGSPGVLVATVTAGPEACTDCLVPQELFRTYVETALRPALGDALPEIRLVYPS